MRQINQSEERLTAALRDLAAASKHGASPEIGLMLQDAFRRHHLRRRRVFRLRVAVVSICFAALASSFLLWKPAVKKAVVVQNGPVVAIPAQPAAHVEATSNSGTPSPVRARRTSRRKNTPAANTFVALPSFDLIPAGDQFRVVRLEMPGEDLRLVGAHVTEEIARRRVTADFVVGHDGTPYAVRLVPTNF